MSTVSNWIDDFNITVGGVSIVTDLVSSVSVNYSMSMASQLLISPNVLSVS